MNDDDDDFITVTIKTEPTGDQVEYYWSSDESYSSEDKSPKSGIGTAKEESKNDESNLSPVADIPNKKRKYLNPKQIIAGNVISRPNQDQLVACEIEYVKNEPGRIPSDEDSIEDEWSYQQSIEDDDFMQCDEDIYSTQSELEPEAATSEISSNRIYSYKKIDCRPKCLTIKSRTINSTRKSPQPQDLSKSSEYVCNIYKKNLNNTNYQESFQNEQKNLFCDEFKKFLGKKEAPEPHGTPTDAQPTEGTQQYADWSSTFINKSHSDSERPHKCEVCLKAFVDVSRYRRHKKIHFQEKPYKCEVCTKAFFERSDYKRHMKIHSDDKPYKCMICSKAFAVKSNFGRHMRSHSQEKPYICSVCSKAFSDRSNLGRHLKTHSDDKSYKCEICSKEFKYSSLFMKHLKTHSEQTIILV